MCYDSLYNQLNSLIVWTMYLSTHSASALKWWKIGVIDASSHLVWCDLIACLFVCVCRCVALCMQTGSPLCRFVFADILIPVSQSESPLSGTDKNGPSFSRRAEQRWRKHWSQANGSLWWTLSANGDYCCCFGCLMAHTYAYERHNLCAFAVLSLCVFFPFWFSGHTWTDNADN